jgi:hypothetical protein
MLGPPFVCEASSEQASANQAEPIPVMKANRVTLERRKDMTNTSSCQRNTHFGMTTSAGMRAAHVFGGVITLLHTTSDKDRHIEPIGAYARLNNVKYAIAML